MGSARNFPIPELTEDVTSKWLSSVLNLEIKENSLSLEGNTGAGVGFLGNVVRVEFQDRNSMKHNYVVKLLPPPSLERDYVTYEKMDRCEISFYKILVPALVQEIPSLEKYLCPFLYGDLIEEDKEKNIEGASVLIMRDLKKDGYAIKPFSSHHLSTEEINLTLDFFAKLHISSTLLEMRKQKPLNQVYDFFSEWYSPNLNLDMPLRAHTWFTAGFEQSKRLINEYITSINPSESKTGLEIISKMLEPLASHAQTIFNLVLKSSAKNACLIHGDMWQNNILVHSDESKPSIKVIDWQIMGYSDSVNDLARFLLTSMSPNLNLPEIEKFARTYYDIQEQLFMETAKEQDLDMKKIKPRRSWEEFWQTMKTVGFTYLFIVEVMGAESYIMFPENLGKVFAMFRFLHFDADLTDFLLKSVLT